jgi:hypothetical protein
MRFALGVVVSVAATAPGRDPAGCSASRHRLRSGFECCALLMWTCLLFARPRRDPPRRSGNFYLLVQIKVTKTKDLNTSRFE